MPRIFIGNLGHDCRQRDIEKLFRGYGELKNINIKGQYGFMEIEDRDDAEDAIKDINGKAFNGGRIKVEFSYAYSGSDRDRRSGGRGFDRDKGGRRVSDGKFRRTNYRLIVQNISSGTSWQVTINIFNHKFSLSKHLLFFFYGSFLIFSFILFILISHAAALLIAHRTLWHYLSRNIDKLVMKSWDTYYCCFYLTLLCSTTSCLGVSCVSLFCN